MNMFGIKNFSLLDIVIMCVALSGFYWGTFYFAQDRTVAMLLVGAGIIMICEFLRRWAAKEQSMIIYAWVLMVVITSFGLIVRWLMIKMVSYDMAVYFVPWYDYIASHGGWSALSTKVGGYSPVYSYYLAWATYWPIDKVVAIKILPILFDFILAVFIYRIVRLRQASSIMPVMAFAAVVLLPTLAFNSGSFGQFDSVYMALIFGSLYYALLIVDNKYDSRKMSRYKFIAISLVGLGIAVKLHAVLFFIPLMVLYVGRYIERRYFVLIPVIYLLLLVPSLIIGLPWEEAINYRTVEVNYYREMFLGAPTIYQLLPYYPADPFQIIGIFSAAGLAVMLALVMSRRKVVSKNSLIRITLISLLVVPFILPAMRERYFLPAEIAAIVYAFYFPKRWFVPVVLSTVMLLIGNHWWQSSLVVGFLVVLVLKDFFVNEVLDNKASVEE